VKIQNNYIISIISISWRDQKGRGEEIPKIFKQNISKFQGGNQPTSTWMYI